jgi:hypothetical protein
MRSRVMPGCSEHEYAIGRHNGVPEMHVLIQAPAIYGGRGRMDFLGLRQALPLRPAAATAGGVVRA